jgi:hypothetical protein
MSVFNDLENCYISISQTENENSITSSDKEFTKKFQSEEEIDGSREKRNPNLIFSNNKDNNNRTISKNKKPIYNSSINKPKSSTMQKNNTKPEISIKNMLIDKTEYDRLKLKNYVELTNLEIVIKKFNF